jgi:uncharacterized protein DUF6510
MIEHTLDGNALAAPLFDIFGVELTSAAATCGTCDTTHVVAELVVFADAPGTVARCCHCGAVLIVLVTRGQTTCLDLTGLCALEPISSS